MLRIIQSKSAHGAKKYFSTADYYSEGQELTGNWFGRGAERLGLFGEVQQGDFDALCENRFPGTQNRLTPRNKNDRTVGYDFNFHVHKSISLAYMLNEDDRILDAFRDSVRETMAEIETDVKTRVRTKGRDEERAADGIAGAEFIHLTARPVNGLPDPHLHAHCYVFNTTYDEKEDRWKAAYFRDLKRDAPFYQASFNARLAYRLKELGYPIKRHGKDWAIDGVSKDLNQKFSRRTTQINEKAAEKGISSDKEKDSLGSKTRENKSKDLSMPELRQHWRGMLNEDDKASLAQIASSKEPLEHSMDAASLAMAHAIGHCFERDSVVPIRELMGEALRHGVGDVTLADLQREATKQGVIVRQWQGRNLCTTKNVLAEERAMLDFAKDGKRRCKSLNSEWIIKRKRLDAGQRHAVLHVTKSKDRVMMINGLAGAGKTTLMQEAVEALEGGGHRVMTFAPSSNASRGVLVGDGFKNATTVAELLVNPKLQEQAKNVVIWVDEAGQLGTRQLKQVFDLAERAGARVILSGDWRQHGSVERGSPMKLLTTEAGIRPAVVSEIKRQENVEYKDAVAAIAKGDVEDGFRILDKELGWIHELDSKDRAKAVAKEYADTLQETGQAPLVISPTHVEGDRVSKAIRYELKSRKLIGEDDNHVLRLISRNLTDAQRADAAMYEPGDVIVFQQHCKGHKKGDRITIGETVPDSELLRQSKRFQVYQQSTLPLTSGDKIRFTAGGHTLDGRRINNGTTYKVSGFDEAGNIRLDNGWKIARDHAMMAPGYVVTSHSSQGKTVPKVIVVESAASLGAANLEQFYVSVSRGKHQAKIFTDDKSELLAAVSRSKPQIAAVELVGSPTIRLSRMRQIIKRARDYMLNNHKHEQPRERERVYYGRA